MTILAQLDTDSVGTCRSRLLTKEVKVIVMLVSDGVMVGMMVVTWAIQLLVFHDYLDWNRSGWIIQHVGLRSTQPGVENMYGIADMALDLANLVPVWSGRAPSSPLMAMDPQRILHHSWHC